jgi:hypothetical protein
MADDSSLRINRLAQRAKRLDEMIQKAAEMQKHIVEEIRRIGQGDKVARQRATATPKARRKRSRTR